MEYCQDIQKEMVSAIMPAYNASPYIADAIQSVMKQNYSNWELLIVEDGSSEGIKNEYPFLKASFLEYYSYWYHHV